MNLCSISTLFVLYFQQKQFNYLIVLLACDRKGPNFNMASGLSLTILTFFPKYALLNFHVKKY